jgi:hypothetical protein
MALNARTVGAISASRVSGMRTERSPAPKRSALVPSARTGRSALTRIRLRRPRSTPMRSIEIAVRCRISLQISFSRLTEDGVMARIP